MVSYVQQLTFGKRGAFALQEISDTDIEDVADAIEDAPVDADTDIGVRGTPLDNSNEENDIDEETMQVVRTCFNMVQTINAYVTWKEGNLLLTTVVWSLFMRTNWLDYLDIRKRSLITTL